jgi:hypothetical protein
MSAYGIKRCTLFRIARETGDLLMKRILLATLVVLLATAAFAADSQRYLVATKRPFAAGALRAVRDSAARDVEPRDVRGFQLRRGIDLR